MPADPVVVDVQSAYLKKELGNCLLAEYLGKKTEMSLVPKQPGDVPDPWVDVEALREDVGCTPSTPVEKGVRRLVVW